MKNKGYLFVALILLSINIVAKTSSFFIYHTSKYSELNALFSQYELLSIDAADLNVFLTNNPNTPTLTYCLPKGACTEFTIYENELTSSGLKQYLYYKPKQQREINLQRHRTYSGYVHGENTSVKLYIDNAYIAGIIGNYYIQPLHAFVSDAPINLFILYQAKWVKAAAQQEAKCLSHTVNRWQKNTTPLQKQASSEGECKEVALALAADYSMVQEQGNIENVNKHLLAVINAVQANYEPFNIQFLVSEIVTSNCPSCDPWTSSTSASNLLSSFSIWGNNGGFFNGFDVAQLWTNRDFDGVVVGLADVATVCTNEKYSIVQDYSPNFNSLRALSAHELGHSFGAEHDATTSPYIMRPSISAAATEFSPASTAAIEPFIASRTCLENCPDCASVSGLFVYDYNNGSGILSWLDNGSNYQIIIEEADNPFTIINTTTSNFEYSFSGLSPCKNYIAKVRQLCSDGTSGNYSIFSLNANEIPNINFTQPNGESANFTWSATDLPINIRLLAVGAPGYLEDFITTDTSYTFTGLFPCFDYQVELQTVCEDGTFGSLYSFDIEAASAFVVASALSANQAQVLFSSNDDANFQLVVRNPSSGNILFDSLAQPNQFYPVSGLSPCVSYQAEISASCIDGSFSGPLTTFPFTTADFSFSNISTNNCDYTNSTYDLFIDITHNNLSSLSDSFSVYVGTPPSLYRFAYEASSPQTVSIADLPANGEEDIEVMVIDESINELCSSTTTYDAPRAECNCSTFFSEDFEGCQLPSGWNSYAIGSNNAALWQVGSTIDAQSLDGTCMLFFDDDNFDGDGGEITVVESPSLNLGNLYEASLSFDYNFNTIAGSFAVEVWDGTTWQTIFNRTWGFCGFWGCDYPTATIDISSYLNPNFKFRFVYDDGNNWDWYVGIDNIDICGYSNLNSCDAGFYYLTDTFCPESDFPQAVITGNPHGVFTATPAGLLIDSLTGNIDVAASLANTYTITYTSNLYGTCQSSQTININSACSTNVSMNVILAGAVEASSGLMRTELHSLLLVPRLQPYNQAPWWYFGSESVSSPAVFPSNTVDWLLIELRSSTDINTLAAQKSVILLSNGQVSDIAHLGSTPLVSFEGIVPNNAYYVAIRHRNHLAAISNAPIYLNNNTLVDFGSMTTSAQHVTDSGQQHLLAADIFAEGVINTNDYNSWYGLQPTFITYTTADVNLDANVNTNDFTILKQNLGTIGPVELRY